tara:strand:- start:140 stop:748 length:609 start_codon:yes stop_codon:yes gene_type:complete
MGLNLTSELEAVNRVLRMMGEAPVNSLEGQFGLARQAHDSLKETSRTVQAEGWSFNTDYERTLTRTAGTNEIELSSDISRVKIDPYEYPDNEVVQRGLKLYDRRKNTSVFEEDLTADVTYILSWTDLPEHARQYIMVKAGRQLQDQILGSADLTQINLTMEAEAKALFMEEENNAGDHNMIRGNPNHTGVFQTYQPSRTVLR